MEWKILRYGHIPGIILDPDQEIQAGSGQLRAVPFEEWVTFVGRPVMNSERRYRQIRPVFYVDEITVDDSGEGLDLDLDLKLPFRQLLVQVQTALIYAARTPLPDPLQSTRYLLVPESKQRFRDIGERDIEWMIYGSTWQRLIFSPEWGTSFNRILARLVQLDYGATPNELHRLLEVVKLSLVPPFQSGDVLVHAVIALEDVLNPEGEWPLGQVFARRGAHLLAERYGEVKAVRAELQDWYRARSRLVHGESPELALEAFGEQEGTELGRVFQACARLGEVVGTYQERFDPGQALDRLLQDLDAIDDRQGFEAFQDEQPEGWLTR